MYSPYGSYSSMGSPAQPLDIGSGSSYISRSTSSTYHASCAFPSWPQQSRASSYVSDDDLLDLEDDTRSIASSNSSSSVGSHADQDVAQEMHLKMQMEQMAALQREALRQQERERRKQQAAAKQRSRRGSSGSSKKGSKSRSGGMTAISEAVE